MLMLVDLYYAEKCSVIPGALPDSRFTTDETLALSGVSRAEADSYIARFSHIRSVWRMEERGVLTPMEEMRNSLQYQIDELSSCGYFSQDFIRQAPMDEFESETTFNQFMFSTPCFIHAVAMKTWRNKSLTGWL